MTNNLSKIEAFVTSIVENEFKDGQQAMVLATDLEMVGGKNGSCENAIQSACSGKNKTCINIVSTCSANNSKCKNDLLKPDDGYKRDNNSCND